MPNCEVCWKPIEENNMIRSDNMGLLDEINEIVPVGHTVTVSQIAERFSENHRNLDRNVIISKIYGTLTKAVPYGIYAKVGYVGRFTVWKRLK